MPTLEEQFAMLFANAAHQQMPMIPEVMRNGAQSQNARTRTVYSVGEAISQRGQNAKLGTSSNRDSGPRR